MERQNNFSTRYAPSKVGAIVPFVVACGSTFVVACGSRLVRYNAVSPAEDMPDTSRLDAWAVPGAAMLQNIVFPLVLLVDILEDVVFLAFGW